MNENFGKADQDTDEFFKEIQKDVKLNRGFYSVDLDKDNKLQKVLYLSSQMLEYASLFLDIVSVDATYRRNRFNMPLVNVCDIDNFGSSIYLLLVYWTMSPNFFMTDFFIKLREAWKANPLNLISNECNEII